MNTHRIPLRLSLMVVLLTGFFLLTLGSSLKTFPVKAGPAEKNSAGSGVSQLSLLPDLVISFMRIELKNPACLLPGDPLGVRIWVTNNGQAAASAFLVEVNGVRQSLSGLGIGETKSLFFNGYSSLVNATVDVTGLIAESDETNNSRSEMVPIPTPPIPCTPTPTPLPSVTVSLASIGYQDGSVLEFRETSNTGSKIDSVAVILRLGDDAARKQYRSVLSFATGASLPDDAIITKVILKIRKQTINGDGNPISILGASWWIFAQAHSMHPSFKPLTGRLLPIRPLVPSR